jgi:hypothetical protein
MAGRRRGGIVPVGQHPSEKARKKEKEQVMMKTRCAALDIHGRRCRRTDTKPENYHGDSELYGWSLNSNQPTWVRVVLCGKHRRTNRGKAK